MDAKNLEITYSFSRLSNSPLDKSSHFDSQDDLENAYTHSTYTDSPFYDGEVVTVSDSNNGNGGTAYVYQNYNGQTHLDPIILNSEFNCSIVSNAAKYIETSNEQALKITNKYADDSAQKIDTSSIVNLKFVGKCTTDDIGDRTSAFWASNPGDVWFISESFEGDSVQYEAYSHIICIAGPMSTGQTFHDHFNVLGPVTWHNKTIDAYTQDECNTKYMYKENILDDVISQESNTLFGKLNNAVFSSLETNKTEFNILRNIYGKSLVWNQLLKEGYLVDMGLPSGTLWASRNIDITQEDGFAASPFQYESSFFSWGNVDGHNPISNTAFDYDWGGVNSADPWYEGQVYGSTSGNTLTGNIAVGEDFDAARANIGAPWRMPTSVEFQELFNNSKFIDANGDEIDSSVTNKLVNVNGIVGIYIESLINGARLFFSCSGYGVGRSLNVRGSYGYYWSSTWGSARWAQNMTFTREGVYSRANNNRYNGFTVRPVLTHKLTPETDGSGHKFIQYGDNITDLTRVFGAGNESATVEEFKEIFPADHYPYNPGEIISNKTEKLEMTGFNLLKVKGRVAHVGGDLTPTSKRNFSEGEYWNGFTWNGYYLHRYAQTNLALGEGQVSATGVNGSYGIGFPIKCEPNTQYYYKTTYGAIGFFDQEGVFVNYQYVNTMGVFTTPANAAWMVIVVGRIASAYTESNLVVNVSNTDRNGTYEPYKHNDLLLNLTTLTGKLNGIGERVTIFPDGMEGIGNLYDDITINSNAIAHKLVYKLKRADITGLDGGAEGTAGALRYVLSNNKKKTGMTPFLSNFFVQKNGVNVVSDNDIGWLISGYGSNNIIYLTIPASALSGDLTTSTGRRTAFWNWWDANNPVIMIELATPLIYTDLQYANQIDIPITLPVRYTVDNFGTEEIVVPNSIAGEPTSCVPNINIKYNANTIDQDAFIYRTTGGNTDVESGYAYIEEVQGNEIVWNQGFNPTTAGALSGADVTAIKNANGTFTLNGTGSAHANIITENYAFISAHKYFFSAKILTKGSNTNLGASTHGQIYGQNVVDIQTNELTPSVVKAATGTGNGQIRWHIMPNDVYDNVVVAFTLIDLTLAGYPNIDTTTPTVVEVEAWITQSVGYKDYYPYDTGTLLPMKMKAIRTVGFNQWNEQWEVGGYDITTGAKKVSTVIIRSKEYIPIFPNTIYYCNAYNYGGTYAIRLFYYDANKNFLSTIATGNTFTTPMDAYYMNFTLRTEYGITYNNDICINLQKDGSRDGEYKSYWAKEAEFNVMEITGINSNTGQRETIFPNGMCGKGDWADVIYQDGDNTIAIKKAGRVDLGSLNWIYRTAGNKLYFVTGNNTAQSAIIPSDAYSMPDVISPRYTPGTWYNIYNQIVDKAIGIYHVEKAFVVRDTSYTDSETFKSAMSGVMLEYALATPIIYTDLQYVDGRPFNQLWFNTYKDGLIIQNPQTPLSVPMNMDYEKPYNMPAEYICMDSFDTLLDQLGNSMGGTWTKTYNEETQSYEFHFTASS